MKIYHKIQNTFFQIFYFYHIKEIRKNGCDIICFRSLFQRCIGGDCYRIQSIQYTAPRSQRTHGEWVLHNSTLEHILKGSHFRFHMGGVCWLLRVTGRSIEEWNHQFVSRNLAFFYLHIPFSMLILSQKITV